MAADDGAPAGSGPWPALPPAPLLPGVTKFPPSLAAPWWGVLGAAALLGPPGAAPGALPAASGAGPASPCPLLSPAGDYPARGISLGPGLSPFLPPNPGSCRTGRSRAGVVGAAGGTSAAPSAYRSAPRRCGPISSASFTPSGQWSRGGGAWRSPLGPWRRGYKVARRGYSVAGRGGRGHPRRRGATRPGSALPLSVPIPASGPGPGPAARPRPAAAPPGPARPCWPQHGPWGAGRAGRAGAALPREGPRVHRECRRPAGALRGGGRGKGPAVAAGETGVGAGGQPSGGPRAPAAALGPGGCCAPAPGPYRCQRRCGRPCAPPIAGSRG